MIEYSLVIPVYKTPELVVKCLDSIAAAARRTESSIEVIAVDDGSPDACPAILDAYRGFSNCSNVTYIVHHKSNGGQGSARNAGIDIVHGRWVSFVDGDDVVLGNYFRDLDVAIRRDSSVGFIAYGVVPFESEDEIVNETSGTMTDADIVVRDLSQKIGVGDVPEYCLGVLVSSSCLRNLRFKAGYAMGEDLIFANELVLAARKYSRISCPVYGYRQRSGSICHTSESMPKIRDRIYAWRDVLTAFEAAGKRVCYSHVRHYANHLTEFAVYAILSRLPNQLQSSKKELWKIWGEALKDVVGFKCLSAFQRIRIRIYLLLHFPCVAIVLFKLPFFVKISLARFR